MHVNKVHHVTTITRVAEDLGEDEDWLRDVANEMDAEDGIIWVYGVGEDGVMAFTDFGTWPSSSRSTKKTLDCSGADCSTCGLRRMDTEIRLLRSGMPSEQSSSGTEQNCPTF